MNAKEFNERHKQIIQKYNVCFQVNCDAWWLVTGFLYYTGDVDDDSQKPILEVTGIGYKDDGSLYGYFEEYLKLLEEGLEDILGNQSPATPAENNGGER